MPVRTRYLLSTDAQKTSSAVPNISSNEGELRGKNPNLCNLNMKFCSIRAFHCVLIHHIFLLYMSIFVIL